MDNKINIESIKHWKNIYLVGYMGSGKTTVSQSLSAMLSMTAIDLDDIIEDTYGKSIPDIFNEIGEDGFRAIETLVLATTIGGQSVEYDVYKGAIISTGGGIPLNDVNIKAMKTTGQIVYLRTSPEEIYKRFYSNSDIVNSIDSDTNSEIKKRPLIPNNVTISYIKEMMEIREPYYTNAADLVIDTDNKTPEEIAGEIINSLKLDFNTPS